MNTSRSQYEPNRTNEEQRRTDAAHDAVFSDGFKGLTDDFLIQSYQERFDEKGIYAFGYGRLPISILMDKRMRNPHLIAILGLVCSLAGENNQAILARDTACRALGIGYHTFAKYMSMLCEFGYIIRFQPNFNAFGTTEYQLNYDRMTLNEGSYINLKRTSPLGSVARFSVSANQYGNIPKYIMFNETLSAFDKAVYIVLLLMGGFGMEVSIRRDLIAEMLGKTKEETISKHIASLSRAGLVIKKMQYGNGAATGTKYTVLAIPDMMPDVPESWLRHDRVKIMKANNLQPFPTLANFFSIVGEYTSRINENSKRTSIPAGLQDIVKIQDLLKVQMRVEAETRLDATNEKEFEESRVVGKHEDTKQTKALVEELRKKGMSDDDILLSICMGAPGPDGYTLPGMKRESGTNIFWSEDDYRLRFEESEQMDKARKITEYMAELTPDVRALVMRQITDSSLSTMSVTDGKMAAKRTAGQIFSGGNFIGSELVLSRAIQSVITDGISQPFKVFYHGKRLNGVEFRKRLEEKLEEPYYVKSAIHRAIDETKKRFLDLTKNIGGAIAYAQAIFLNFIHSQGEPLPA